MSKKDIIDLIDDFSSYSVMDYDLLEYHEGRVLPLDARIKALEGATGLNGREIELKKGLYPIDLETPEEPQYEAVMWRLVAREGEPDEVWKLLIFVSEITGPPGASGEKGDKGDKGDTGPAGQGLTIKGTVGSAGALPKVGHTEFGWCYYVTGTKEVWMYVGETTETPKLSEFNNLGKITGQKGDKGDTGPAGASGARGPKGDKGDSGGISSFLLNWIVGTATNQAISAVTMELNTSINDAINDMAMQLGNLAEDAAESAVNNAIEDMMDEFKGDKGEKGDKGDKGADGKSVRMVGKYDSLINFKAFYAATKDNVGIAALIGGDGEKKELWAITEKPGLGDVLTTYGYTNMGDIRGPEGPGAEWQISLRDKDFVQKGGMLDIVSDLPSGVAGMYVQDSDSVIVEGIKGSSVNAEQVGMKFSMRYPIPTLVAPGKPLPATAGKILTNDGYKLKWVDQEVIDEIKEEVLLRSPSGKVFSLSVQDDGRLKVEEHV